MSVHKLNALLLIVAVLSALSVVTSQHKSRRIFAELQHEDAQAKQYKEEYDKLLLEQSTQGMHSRIEREATGTLKMKTPDPQRTRVVTANGESVVVVPPKEE